ncbi:ATP synthase F0, C subunit [Rubrobacter xylanophilus DSM 9941]|uniref:ATP synthase subunit c n=2 Tax=Rubrobacter xylanophilus TaxID=49319 RepID=Q1AVH4_RUBXD|nr:ATP synthase F0, C subunit [Rubrobacter xylanophilus DSM 9941]
MSGAFSGRQEKLGNGEEKERRGKRMEMLALLQSVEGAKLIGTGIAAGAGVIGAGAGMGYLIGQTIASIHRQPEAFEQTRGLMFLGIGLVEAFALYALVFALLIAFVL